MYRGRTNSSFDKSRERMESWGDTRSTERAGTRACAFTFPPNTRITDFQKFFGFDAIDGVAIVRGAKKPFAFIQFKRPSDYTNALLRNQELFLDSNYKITILPYLKNESTKKGKFKQPRGLIANNSPTREIRSRSRSRSRERENRYASPEIVRDRSRFGNMDRSYSRCRPISSDRGRNSVRDERSDFSRSDRTRVGQSPMTDEWGRKLETKSGPFNRDDDPDIRSEIAARRLDVQHQVVTQLPPNSHSFGVLSQVSSLPSTIIQGGTSVPSVLVPSSQSNQSAAYLPRYTGQPAQPLEKLPAAAQSIMPRSIELLLNLVLELKTARTLSACQIQNILDYFTDERDAVKFMNNQSDDINNQEAPLQSSPEVNLDDVYSGQMSEGSSQQISSHDPRLKTGNAEKSHNPDVDQLISKILGISKQEK